MNKTLFRSILSGFLAICIISSPCNSVLAVSEGTQPKFVNLMFLNPSLNISNVGYASCNCSVKAYDPKLLLETNIELQRYTDGEWKQIAQWDVEGKDAVNFGGNKYVTSGYSYRVYATVTVKNSSGAVLEQPSAVSKTVYY